MYQKSKKELAVKVTDHKDYEVGFADGVVTYSRGSLKINPGPYSLTHSLYVSPEEVKQLAKALTLITESFDA